MGGQKHQEFICAAHNSRVKQLKYIFPRFMLHNNKQQYIKIKE